MLKIATWNVNSVKARLPHILRWLDDFSPDVVLLQELKCVSEAFPYEDIENLKYNVAVCGQKSYNGVAILSKSPIDIELMHLPGDPEDKQARYIEGFTAGIRVAAIYLPNGNPVDTDKYAYKLNFMERLYNHAHKLLSTEDPFVLGGDYNVIPENIDAYEPDGDNYIQVPIPPFVDRPPIDPAQPNGELTFEQVEAIREAGSIENYNLITLTTLFFQFKIVKRNSDLWTRILLVYV